MGEFNNTDHWDGAAERYEKTAHPYTSRYVDAALAHVPLTHASRVLDVAAGTGALAFAAARAGAQVLATDFSPGMVARIAAKAVSNIEARVMDGQALDLPDEAFDAVFSFFGVFMFPDWRKGLAEMARVTRPAGYGVVAVWQDRGAGAFMLLGQLIRRLFPDRDLAPMPEAMAILSTAEGLASELVKAGYRDPQIEHVTRDFDLDMAMLEDIDALFGPSPDWTGLDAAQKGLIVSELRRMAGDQPQLPIPSTALIGMARR
ncbi:class I SAM-dependent methyltransferase [Amphiplicatus metriothermophilus]|uniref:Methyltransferase domain-containing protein n=1 Tax=Amphiplicatus metriothermophilus TaxID=1519374 RepID=A0A239PT77_9PROT|nr:class I SAM-dependent methyltransferase [Amphiplicatus metriothermophilus]MBB5519375.1 ubiquinone/menaquinone biosynthesis C-methylase UbiE [Amphiplicatus metriothermophilus]SNT73501.1 Methyltransferase domain-containing protein [Amphiplicatus metriothermophilus]